MVKSVLEKTKTSLEEKVNENKELVKLLEKRDEEIIMLKNEIS